MKKLIVVLAVLLSSCASEWQVLDGQRSEGTVTMTYRPRLFVAAPDKQIAVDKSTEICKDWGYGPAKELTDKTKYYAADRGGDRVVQKFQCTITKAPPPLT